MYLVHKHFLLILVISTALFTLYSIKMYTDICSFPYIAGISKIRPFPLAGNCPLRVVSRIANRTWDYYSERLSRRPYYYWPGYFAWNIHYEVRGYINLYRITGNKLWLKRAIARCDHMVNLSDVNGDGIPCWGNYNSTWGSPQGPYDPPGMDGSVVIDGVISIAVMETALAIYGFYEQIPASEFFEKANRYVKVVKGVIEKWRRYWTKTSNDEGYYWPTPRPESAKYGIINQFGALCIAQLFLYDLTHDRSYLVEPRACANYFKRALIYLKDRDAYLWMYAYIGPEKAPDRIEDVSHGAMDISFAFEMYKRGLVFNKTDIVRFSNTYVNVFWRETPTGFYLGSHIDGSGYREVPPILWVQLSQFNYRLWFNQWRLTNKFLEKRGVDKVYGGYILQLLTELLLYNPAGMSDCKMQIREEVKRVENIIKQIPFMFQPYKYMAESELKKARTLLSKDILMAFTHLERSLRMISITWFLGVLTYLIIGAWIVYFLYETSLKDV